MNGVVFYQGPSQIDERPIVGIATLSSSNLKTGNLIQTWILRSDIHPQQAINTGADSSVCGNCPLRGEIRPASASDKNSLSIVGDTVNKGRGCYVIVGQAPAAIYRSYKAGNYPKLTKHYGDCFIGRALRYGSYGDPVAIPMRNWRLLESLCAARIAPGYTHQWRNPLFQSWRTKLMASTHTAAENDLAHEMGWRTFRTLVDGSTRTKNEIVCPASKEAGFRATCATCGACNGRASVDDKRASVAILAHGSGGKPDLVEQVLGRIALVMV